MEHGLPFSTRTTFVSQTLAQRPPVETVWHTPSDVAPPCLLPGTTGRISIAAKSMPARPPITSKPVSLVMRFEVTFQSPIRKTSLSGVASNGPPTQDQLPAWLDSWTVFHDLLANLCIAHTIPAFPPGSLPDDDPREARALTLHLPNLRTAWWANLHTPHANFSETHSIARIRANFSGTRSIARIRANFCGTRSIANFFGPITRQVSVNVQVFLEDSVVLLLVYLDIHETSTTCLTFRSKKKNVDHTKTT